MTKLPGAASTWILALLLVAGGAALFAGMSLAHETGTVHVKVWANDYHFETNRTTGENPDFTLERGATYEITLVNNGSADHSFWLADPVNEGTQQIGTGEQDSVTVDVPWDAPDTTFDYFCTVSGHRNLGMEGAGDFHGGNDAPNLSVSHPADGADVQGTVDVSGDVLDEPPVTVEVKAPPSDEWTEADVGGDSWTYGWDSTQVDDGNHTIQVRARDHHDFATFENITVEVVNDVNQPPDITIDRPPEGAEVSGDVTVEGTASDADGNLASVEVNLPDAGWTEIDGPDDEGAWETTWNASAAGTGDHTLRARAQDAEGEVTTVERNVTVVAESANAAPAVQIDEPEDGATVEGTVTFAGTATDSDGDDLAVEVNLPGGDWTEIDGPDDEGAWETTWDAGEADPGDHTLRVRAGDGQETAAASVTVTVEGAGNAPPTLAFRSPDEGAEVVGDVTVVLEATDVDDGDSVEEVRVRFDTESSFRDARAESGDRWRILLSAEDLDPGTHRIIAVASDGDHATKAVREVLVPAGPSSAAPALEVTNPPPAEATGIVAVAGSVEDDHVQSPPLRVELRVDGEQADFAERAKPGSFQLAWQTHRTPDGVHDVTVQAFDGTAASGAETFAVRVVNEAAEAAGAEGALATPGPGPTWAAAAAALGAAAARGRDA